MDRRFAEPIPPTAINQLHRLLALRLGVAAAAIGLISSAAAYLFEAHRLERLAWDNALSGARHFESPAMRRLLDVGGEHHVELTRLLDRTRFVGIRIRQRDGSLVFEAWADIPDSFVVPAQARIKEWPVEDHRRAIRVDLGEERLILARLPLLGQDGVVIGFLEATSRIDSGTLQAQRDQTRNAALTSAVSVLAAAALLYPVMRALLRRSTVLAKRLLDSNLSLIRALGNAVAKRDSDTDAHNYRVTLYAVALAEAMALPQVEIAILVTGAFLHDVGKIGIPDHILRKSGKLTADESDVMRSHVSLGLEIVSGNPWLDGAALTIGQHHERFDGTGYPRGLRGEEIARVARVFAVADVFDAITTHRPYRDPMSLPEALALIENESGRHFDPEVVNAFRRVARASFRRVSTATDGEVRAMLGAVVARYFGDPSRQSPDREGDSH